jgi:branched-chain amino acid transport system substrate-binding protein
MKGANSRCESRGRPQRSLLRTGEVRRNSMKRTMQDRGRKFGVMVGLFVMVAVFLGTTVLSSGAEKKPIKIGFLAPSTGNWAQNGMDMVDGFRVYLEEINYTVADRKIELIVEDEGESPSNAVTKVRKLINQDKVDLIAGIWATNSAYAVAPEAESAKVPVIITLSAGDDLTQRKRSPYLVRLSFTGCQLGHVAGDYAYNKLGWRKVVNLGMDYAWGWETIGAFQRVFEEEGGKVIQKVWTPVTTLDFGPYAVSLKKDADGIFEVVTGGASIRFIKTLRNSGLMDKWKIFAPGTAVDETLLPALGDNGLGVLSVFPWSWALNLPANEQFKERVRKSLKKEATGTMAMNYTGAQWIVKAISAVGGDVEDKNKFMQAVRSIEIKDSIRGPLKLDKYGMVVDDIYIRRVEKMGGMLENAVVEKYPQVSQFWKYDPETYVKSPVYSRDYPPCKFCQ